MSDQNRRLIEEQNDQLRSIHDLLSWGSRKDAQPFLGVAIGGAICVALSIGLAALGGWLFDLDKTQCCIVFAGSLVGSILLIEHGTFPGHGHAALATKALVLATLQDRCKCPPRDA